MVPAPLQEKEKETRASLPAMLLILTAMEEKGRTHSLASSQPMHPNLHLWPAGHTPVRHATIPAAIHTASTHTSIHHFLSSHLWTLKGSSSQPPLIA